MLGILDGLTRFHGTAANQGVQATHLDLKPSNILISRAGEMVISDCGTSRVTHEDRTRLTTQRFVGTTAYSPPWTERDAQFSHPQPKLNQSFDVWSMACILLEVLIFIIQDVGGIKRFRVAKTETNMDGIMNSESSRSTFWYFESREQNTAKLKDIVAEWLDRADAMAQITEDNTGTLSRLAARLRVMFRFGPIERGTIEDCSRHLRGDLVAPSRSTSQLPLETPNVSTGFGFRSRSYTEQDLEAMIDIVHESNSNLFGGDELGYIDGSNQSCRGIPRTVSNLPLTYLRGHAQEECPCRIRIFENEQILTISIAFVLRGRIFFENVTLQRKLDSLAQRNLFDVNRHQMGETGVIWGFTGLHQTQLFKTRDLTSFMAIQEVLLGQEYIPGIIN
ncbi:kinase-like domain-containing protein [Terfezia claveryi]|nr:kinase-like domain-containing protein [Terfezia claveryi]